MRLRSADIRTAFLSAATAMLPLSVSAAPAKWEPPESPELRALKGAQVAVLFDVDLDGDKQASPAETDYLFAVLHRCEATVSTQVEPQDKPVAALILGTPVKPVLTEQQREDPLSVVEHEMALKRFNEAARQIEEARAYAAGQKVRVIESAEVLTSLGMKPVTPEVFAAYERHRAATRLAGGRIEVRLEGVALSDGLEFLGILAQLPLTMDAEALAANTIKPDTVVHLHVKDLPLVVTLELLADEVNGVFVTDGKVLRLTTREAAGKMQGFEPIGDLFRRELPDSEEDLAARLKGAQAMLDRPITQPPTRMPMGDLIRFLRESSGYSIHVDRSALLAAGVDVNALVAVGSDRQTIRQILTKLEAAAPKVAVYVDEGHLFRVTTRDRAEAAVKGSKSSTLVVPR